MKISKINIDIKKLSHDQDFQQKAIHSSKNKSLSPSTKRLKYCFNKQKQTQKQKKIVQMQKQDNFLYLQDQFMQFQDITLNPKMYSPQRLSYYSKLIKQYYKKNWHPKQKENETKHNPTARSAQNPMITRRSLRQNLKDKLNVQSISTLRFQSIKENQNSDNTEQYKQSLNVSVDPQLNKQMRIKHRRISSLNVIDEKANKNISNRRGLVYQRKQACRTSTKSFKQKSTQTSRFGLTFEQKQQNNRYKTIERDQYHIKQNSIKDFIINPYTNREYLHIKNQSDQTVIKQFQQFFRSSNSNSIVRSYKVKAISISDKNNLKQAQSNYQNPQKRYKKSNNFIPSRKSNIKRYEKQDVQILVDPWQSQDNIDFQIVEG